MAPAVDVSLAEVIEAWGRRHLRDLPWRRTRDPWRILVVEVMAQQTGLDRVLGRWEDFCARFPDPAALAGAEPGEVIRAWSGLGYNRRALALHRAAERIVECHGGAVPRRLEDLLALPGVGPYTAHAVRAFAFEEEAVVVDTNVGRVLARLEGRRLTRRGVEDLAARFAAGRDPWWWNQSIMEFGALVCRARSPGCDACPVGATCRWRGIGPDPAAGSAAVSGRQAPFAGSDREGRGRLVEALRAGPVALAEAAAVMGWPDEPARARQVVGRLLDEGLVRCRGEELVL